VLDVIGQSKAQQLAEVLKQKPEQQSR